MFENMILWLHGYDCAWDATLMRLNNRLLLAANKRNKNGE